MNPFGSPPRERHSPPVSVRWYLEGPKGRLTPERVQKQLLSLDWQALGASSSPSVEQVHWTRLWLEETALHEARRLLRTVRGDVPREREDGPENSAAR